MLRFQLEVNLRSSSRLHVNIESASSSPSSSPSSAKACSDDERRIRRFSVSSASDALAVCVATSPRSFRPALHRRNSDRSTRSLTFTPLPDVDVRGIATVKNPAPRRPLSPLETNVTRPAASSSESAASRSGSSYDLRHLADASMHMLRTSTSYVSHSLLLSMSTSSAPLVTPTKVSWDSIHTITVQLRVTQPGYEGLNSWLLALKSMQMGGPRRSWDPRKAHADKDQEYTILMPKMVDQEETDGGTSAVPESQVDSAHWPRISSIYGGQPEVCVLLDDGRRTRFRPSESMSPAEVRQFEVDIAAIKR